MPNGPDEISEQDKNINPVSADSLAECYGLDKADLPKDAYPLSFKNIQKEQRAQPTLMKEVEKGTAHYSTKAFRGGGKHRTLVCRKGKIAIPTSLQERTIQWYHNTLCHPGENRTEQTIRQHFWWNTLRDAA